MDLLRGHILKENHLLFPITIAAALALFNMNAGTAMAKTFVYVSNALDANIDVFAMDKATGALVGGELRVERHDV